MESRKGKTRAEILVKKNKNVTGLINEKQHNISH
jgi:hypothetical protein